MHPAAMKVTVRTREGSRSIDCAEEDRILYAALRAGLDVPYECATGTCGTCKARARPGSVTELWPEAPGHAYLKPERGEFLMCQARSLGDCEILVPGRPVRTPAGTIRPAERRGTVSSSRKLTHDVRHLEIALDEPASFHPGQFMVIEAPGISGYRAYSMASFARETRRLAFVVKNKPGGAFSEWLFGTDVGGAELTLFGPLGRATFHPEEDKDLFCIAGGSGIAGMMSMLERACQEGYFENHRGQVFFGVRTMKDTFFLDELSSFRALAPGHLDITVALSDEDAPQPEAADHPDLNYATGLVHQVAGRHASNGFENATTAFVAGPPPMVDCALHMLVLEARLPADDIRYDKFS